MKKYLALEKWNDDYNGAAIYSLVDQDGKRYIGQAKHLQERLHTHRIALNKALKGCDTSGEGQNLVEAVRSGKRFRVEILKKIHWTDATVNNLRYWENHYYEKYGGKSGTYNTGPMFAPLPFYDGFNEVEMEIELDRDVYGYLSKMDDMNSFIKKAIRKEMKRGE